MSLPLRDLKPVWSLLLRFCAPFTATSHERRWYSPGFSNEPSKYFSFLISSTLCTGPTVVRNFKCPVAHPVICNLAKDPQCEPQRKPGQWTASASFDLCTSGFVHNIEKPVLQEGHFAILSFGEMQAGFFNDLAVIGRCDFLVLEPTQNCLAGLKRSAFTFKCNRLVLANGTTSPDGSGNSGKSPGTYLSLTSAFQICRWSLGGPQKIGQQRRGSL